MPVLSIGAIATDKAPYRLSSGQNQFSSRGDAQSVFALIVFDHKLLRIAKQLFAADMCGNVSSLRRLLG